MVELYLFNFWYFSGVPKISVYYFGSLRKDKLSGGISSLFKITVRGIVMGQVDIHYH